MSRMFFENGIRTEDLINGVENVFDIDPNHQENASDEDEFYDERFDEYDDTGNEVKPIELNVPFDELKEQMVPITDDGCVRKQVIKNGVGVVVPEKSVVIIHYDAFLEDQKLPFDSTRLRNRPHKFLLYDGNVIAGLDIGVKTMKKEEMSRFLITPEYGYGAMGCPPRIPGNAKIMYVVELLNFFESKDAVEFDEMTPDEQKKAPFDKIVAVFHCEHQVANDLFRNKHYASAIARYRKMVRLLEDVSVANEEEDKQRNGYLMKLYLNICLSYTNILKSQKAITYGLLAHKLDENHPKALYRLGCAFLSANEFDKAKHYLLKAKQHKPFETCVHKVLLELERKRKQFNDYEKIFCRRIFVMENDEKRVVCESPEFQEFRSVLENQIQKFLDSDEKEYAFSSGYTDWQEDIVKDIASQHDLAFISKIHYDKKIIKIAKK